MDPNDLQRHLRDSTAARESINNNTTHAARTMIRTDAKESGSALRYSGSPRAWHAQSSRARQFGALKSANGMIVDPPGLLLA
eukprot:scaffold426589_cov23-Prasinocladus_malaysianus.AAC.1